MIEAPNEAIYRFGPPDIMNRDKGSKFTSFVWTDRLRRSGIRISLFELDLDFEARDPSHSMMALLLQPFLNNASA
ncbi:hypothetical protein ACEWPM_012455 [Roseovarius sp. S4756]|uniref:hypothetical protein n=1 Tax=Roseovarius maritimus TaxID=3342637 RepID=UPI00372B9025